MLRDLFQSLAAVQGAEVNAPVFLQAFFATALDSDEGVHGVSKVRSSWRGCSEGLNLNQIENVNLRLFFIYGLHICSWMPTSDHSAVVYV